MTDPVNPPVAETVAVPSAPPTTCGLAIWFLVLGLLGLFTCGLSAIAGIICGAVALSRIKSSGGRLTGHGLAIAGVIVSAVFFIFIFFGGPALLLPVLARAREDARRTCCTSNLHQIGQACMMFADVPTNGTYPKNLGELYPNFVCDPRVFICPSVRTHGAGVGTIPACDYSYVPGSGPTDVMNVIAYCRHGDGYNVRRGDGSVEFMNETVFRKDLDWTERKI